MRCNGSYGRAIDDKSPITIGSDLRIDEIIINMAGVKTVRAVPVVVHPVVCSRVVSALSVGGISAAHPVSARHSLSSS